MSVLGRLWYSSSTTFMFQVIFNYRPDVLLLWAPPQGQILLAVSPTWCVNWTYQLTPLNSWFSFTQLCLGRPAPVGLLVGVGTNSFSSNFVVSHSYSHCCWSAVIQRRLNDTAHASMCDTDRFNPLFLRFYQHSRENEACSLASLLLCSWLCGAFLFFGDKVRVLQLVLVEFQ